MQLKSKEEGGGFPQKGLYVITRDPSMGRWILVEEVRAALAGGAVAVQYRAKDGRRSKEEASALLNVCRAFAAPLIVNDDVALAAEIGADGVHLGREDGDLLMARRYLGPQAIIGISCYDDLDRARQAQQAGASYVAFGRFFPSKTKPHAPCADLGTLTAAKSEIQVPIVAIGGITQENGGQLIGAGADVLAVIEGVFGEQSPDSAACGFRALWA